MDSNTYLIVKEVLYANNANIIVYIKNKIGEVIELLQDNSKNVVAINLLKQITITLNSIIENINDNSDKLNSVLRNIDNMDNKINNMNNKFDELIEKKNYGTLINSFRKYVGQIKNGMKDGKGIYYFEHGKCKGDRD